MNYYDFPTLSPNEFEHLTRDLLQKKMHVFIESFGSGRDAGIDLRCAKDKPFPLFQSTKAKENLNKLLWKLSE